MNQGHSKVTRFVRLFMPGVFSALPLHYLFRGHSPICVQALLTPVLQAHRHLASSSMSRLIRVLLSALNLCDTYFIVLTHL